MKATNAKRIVLVLALLWLGAWGVSGVWTGVSTLGIFLYFAGVVAYACLGAWGERTRWLPFALALVLTGIVAASTFLLVPVVIGGLIVCAAILMPTD
ncbi:MAG: hypothetical protein WDA16_03845 [Candidatus Thermoplasmatota archaeon]